MTRARKVGIGCGVFGLLLLASPFVYRWWQSRRDEAEFQEQLRLARAEGIPTNASEFRSSIPSASPNENAAPLYKSLQNKLKLPSDYLELRKDLLWSPNSAARRRARELLQKHQADISLAESAARLPKCWFDRNWEDGFAVLLPEFSAMKSAARLLDLRAQIAFIEGRRGDGFRDLETISRIGEHANQEPTAIGRLVGEAIHWIRVSTLGAWAYQSRAPEVLLALKRAIEDLPPPRLKDECRGDLFSTLSLIELAQTEEGREKLGLKPDDLAPAPAEALLSVWLSPSRARIDIVKAHREYWEALGESRSERMRRMEQARAKLFRALLAFPTAARVYGALGYEVDPLAERLERFEARKLQFVALHRILSHDQTRPTVSLDDLKSPFDGKPLSYRIEGRQIVIKVTGQVSNVQVPRSLEIPPGEVLKKR